MNTLVMGCSSNIYFILSPLQMVDFARLVEIVLLCVSTRYDYTTGNNPGNNFIQRAGICLLNALACQVEGQQKLLVGDFGAMEKMLGIIQERLRSSK